MVESKTLMQYQMDFSHFLLDSSAQPNSGLLKSLDRKSHSSSGNTSRYELGLRVYRNNVLYSLTQALAAQFPVVNKLVGTEFFIALSRDYVRCFPPAEPALTYYGDKFANFIAASEACQPLPYLSDVARLEFYCQQALHAADDTMLDLQKLGSLSSELLEQVCLSLTSSATLFTSLFPVDHIWSSNLEDKVEEIQLEAPHAHYMVIYRRGMQVCVISLQPSAFGFLRLLQQGKTIGDACAEVHSQEPFGEAQLSVMLSYLLGLEIFNGFTIWTGIDL